MKILTVFTGGTIGSSIFNGVADVAPDASEGLIRMYQNTGSEDITFDCAYPINILSENSTPDTLTVLCRYMLSIDYSRYDGVIVTHGSDTLSYTSALLGLLLSWVTIPVTVTAADFVLSLPYSNGRDNFKGCVDFIKGFYNGEHKNSGVFTVWKNSGENVKVYISTRINEADGYLDSFASWGGGEFGIIKDGKFVRTQSEINPDYTEPCQLLGFTKSKDITLTDSVLLLRSYPGLDYGSVSLDGKKAAVVILYHSATACTDGGKYSLLRFAERCDAENVGIYTACAKIPEYFYMTSNKMLAKNINSLYNINVCTAYAKVMLAYSLGTEVWKNNLFYESLPNRDSNKDKKG